MKNLKGRCVFAQSGGPTTVINASIAGGLLEALDSENITGVLCAHHGIKGVLDEDFFDISAEDRAELEALKYTPASVRSDISSKTPPRTIPIIAEFWRFSKNTTFVIFSITAATTVWIPAIKSRNICRNRVTI